MHAFSFVRQESLFSIVGSRLDAQVLDLIRFQPVRELVQLLADKEKLEPKKSKLVELSFKVLPVRGDVASSFLDSPNNDYPLPTADYAPSSHSLQAIENKPKSYKPFSKKISKTCQGNGMASLKGLLRCGSCGWKPYAPDTQSWLLGSRTFCLAEIRY
jgi:hypothetical protein